MRFRLGAGVDTVAAGVGVDAGSATGVGVLVDFDGLRFWLARARVVFPLGGLGAAGDAAAGKGAGDVPKGAGDDMLPPEPSEIPLRRPPLGTRLAGGPPNGGGGVGATTGGAGVTIPPAGVCA